MHRRHNTSLRRTRSDFDIGGEEGHSEAATLHQSQSHQVVNVDHIMVNIGNHAVSVMMQLLLTAQLAAQRARPPAANASAGAAPSAPLPISAAAPGDAHGSSPAAAAQPGEGAAGTAATAAANDSSNSPASTFHMHIASASLTMHVDGLAPDASSAMQRPAPAATKPLLSFFMLDVAVSQGATPSGGSQFTLSAGHAGLRDLQAGAEHHNVLGRAVGSAAPGLAGLASTAEGCAIDIVYVTPPLAAAAQPAASAAASGSIGASQQPSASIMTVHLENPRLLFLRRFYNNISYSREQMSAEYGAYCARLAAEAPPAPPAAPAAAPPAAGALAGNATPFMPCFFLKCYCVFLFIESTCGFRNKDVTLLKCCDARASTVNRSASDPCRRTHQRHPGERQQHAAGAAGGPPVQAAPRCQGGARPAGGHLHHAGVPGGAAAGHRPGGGCGGLGRGDEGAGGQARELHRLAAGARRGEASKT